MCARGSDSHVLREFGLLICPSSYLNGVFSDIGLTSWHESLPALHFVTLLLAVGIVASSVFLLSICSCMLALVSLVFSFPRPIRPCSLPMICSRSCYSFNRCCDACGIILVPCSVSLIGGTRLEHLRFLMTMIVELHSSPRHLQFRKSLQTAIPQMSSRRRVPSWAAVSTSSNPRSSAPSPSAEPVGI